MACALTVSFVSCKSDPFALFQNESVTIIPPDTSLVFDLFPNVSPSWTLVWYDSDGEPVIARNVTGSSSITLKKGLLTPVLLIPETVGTGIQEGQLPSAGAIYPVHASTCGSAVCLETSWLRGITADCARSVCLSATAGFDAGRTIAAHFNWERLDEELTKKAYPQTLNKETLVNAILAGKMSIYKISCSGATIITLTLDTDCIPDGCRFFSGWPSSGEFIWTPECSVSFSVPEGVSFFYSTVGYITILAEAGKENPIFAFFSTYDLQD